MKQIEHLLLPLFNWRRVGLATFGMWFCSLTVFAQHPSAIGPGTMYNRLTAERLGNSTRLTGLPTNFGGMQANRRDGLQDRNGTNSLGIQFREGDEERERQEFEQDLEQDLEQELEREQEESEEIETDRDSFTPSTNVVSRGRLVVESSYSFLDNRIGPETHSFPELLFRYGWNDHLELRLGWNYEIGGVNSILTGNVPGQQPIESEEGSRLLYGIKRFLTEQDGLRPTSSVIIQGSTPTHGESNLTFLSVTPVAGWKFRNETEWDFASRFSTSGELDDRFNIWSPSTVIKAPFGERAKAHIEYFGVFTDGRTEETNQHFISPGVHYLLTPDLEVGWRVGWGLNDQSPNFFVNFGIGRQF